MEYTRFKVVYNAHKKVLALLYHYPYPAQVPNPGIGGFGIAFALGCHPQRRKVSPRFVEGISGLQRYTRTCFIGWS